VKARPKPKTHEKAVGEGGLHRASDWESLLFWNVRFTKHHDQEKDLRIVPVEGKYSRKDISRVQRIETHLFKEGEGPETEKKMARPKKRRLLAPPTEGDHLSKANGHGLFPKKKEGPARQTTRAKVGQKKKDVGRASGKSLV